MRSNWPAFWQGALAAVNATLWYTAGWRIREATLRRDGQIL